MKDDRTGQDVAGAAALAGLDAPTADAIPEARAKAALSAFDACPVWADDSLSGDEKEHRAMIDAVRAVDASNPEVMAMRGALTAVGFPVQDGEPLDKAFARAWEWCTEMAHMARGTSVDASRPAAAERTFPRVTLSTVKPGSLIEILSGDIGLVLDGCYGAAPRYVAWVATGHVDTMPADATVSLRATPGELDALTSADASRPGLTLKQSRAWVERRFPTLTGYAKQCCIEIAVRASRGETGDPQKSGGGAR